jgi:UDP-N-acetylmuramate dehydrogenase
LLDQAGLKGRRVGGAEISTLHANFIVAHDDATADDVLHLIRLARARVAEATGIELEPEVDIW